MNALTTDFLDKILIIPNVVSLITFVWVLFACRVKSEHSIADTRVVFIALVLSVVSNMYGDFALGNFNDWRNVAGIPLIAESFEDPKLLRKIATVNFSWFFTVAIPLILMIALLYISYKFSPQLHQFLQDENTNQPVHGENEFGQQKYFITRTISVAVTRFNPGVEGGFYPMQSAVFMMGFMTDFFLFQLIGGLMLLKTVVVSNSSSLSLPLPETVAAESMIRFKVIFLGVPMSLLEEIQSYDGVCRIACPRRNRILQRVLESSIVRRHHQLPEIEVIQEDYFALEMPKIEVNETSQGSPDSLKSIPSTRTLNSVSHGSSDSSMITDESSNIIDHPYGQLEPLSKPQAIIRKIKFDD